MCTRQSLRNVEQHTWANVPAALTFSLDDLGASHLPSANLTFPICKMGAGYMFYLLRGYSFSFASPNLCPTHQQILTHPSGYVHNLATSHAPEHSSLGPLKLGHSGSPSLISLPLPRPSPSDDHHSSQRDP